MIRPFKGSMNPPWAAEPQRSDQGAFVHASTPRLEGVWGRKEAAE